MKKKLFILFTILIAFNTQRINAKLENPIKYAELEGSTFNMSTENGTNFTIDECVSVVQNDKVFNIKWDGRRSIMGAIYEEHKEVKTTSEWTTKDGACGPGDNTRPPACCYYIDPKDGDRCSGSMCSPSTATTHVEDICLDEEENTNEDGETVCLKPGKKYTCRYLKITTTETGRIIKGDRNIYNLRYELDINNDKTDYDGDPTYCIQPGATGPDKKGRLYKLLEAFDVSKCYDQFNTYNSETKKYESAVECGLAQILYQSYKKVEKSDGDYTYESNGKYDDAAITLALRLWMSSYSKSDPNNPDSPTLYDIYIEGDSPSAESDILGWIPKENYYEITSKWIRKGYYTDEKITKGNYTGYKFYNSSNIYYNTSNSAINEHVKGRIGCSTLELKKDNNGKVVKDSNGNEFIPSSKGCVIDQAIKLFNDAENVSREKYLGGINFQKSVPVIETNVLTNEIVVKVDKEYIEDFVPCTDFSNPACEIIPHYYAFAGGRWIEVTDKITLHADGTIDVNKPTIVYKPEGLEKICKEITNLETIKIVLTSKKWKRNHGFVKFYQAAAQSTTGKKYQIMVSFGTKLEKCYDEKYDKKNGRIETVIPVPCKKDGCDVKGKVTQSDCGTTKVEDPSMSCILNASNPSLAQAYDATEKYGVDRKYCTIYEREDTDIYVPDATSVYSGMQFSYNINSQVKNAAGLSSLLPTTEKNNTKLTSVALQKKQITSKINYKAWEEDYNAKNALLLRAYRDDLPKDYINVIKADLDALIVKLNQCNLSNVYSQNKDLYTNSNCTANSCISLSGVSYDKKYENLAMTLSRNIGLIGSKEMKYCSGNGCFPYGSGGVSIKTGNQTKELSRVTGKNSVRKETVQTNDYATMTIRVENDYYLSTKYKTDAYTGKVTVNSTNSDEGNDSATSLADFTYPVKLATKTGKMDINFAFNNVRSKAKLYSYKGKSDNISSLSSKCYINVYNVTTSYDCKIVNKDNEVDISQCADSKYKVVDGVPVIENSSQITWEDSGSNKLGITYRTVELEKLFPSTSTDSRWHELSNWANQEETIKAIEATSEKIFVDGQYLQYQYILTPRTIKAIREYNLKQLENSGAGYLNNTLYNCKEIEDSSGLKLFTECKSRFLHNQTNGLPGFEGVKISGSKAVNG